jgi:hypothetical protein
MTNKAIYQTSRRLSMRSRSQCAGQDNLEPISLEPYLRARFATVGFQSELPPQRSTSFFAPAAAQVEGVADGLEFLALEVAEQIGEVDGAEEGLGVVVQGAPVADVERVAGGQAC